MLPYHAPYTSPSSPEDGGGGRDSFMAKIDGIERGLRKWEDQIRKLGFIQPKFDLIIVGMKGNRVRLKLHCLHGAIKRQHKDPVADILSKYSILPYHAPHTSPSSREDGGRVRDSFMAKIESNNGGLSKWDDGIWKLGFIQPKFDLIIVGMKVNRLRLNLYFLHGATKI